MYRPFEGQMHAYMESVTYFNRNLENLILKKVRGLEL